MGLFSKKGAKFFDKKMPPKCDYCQFGKRTKTGDKILCEIKALVDPNYSCGKFVYSPLKRIPVKQLNSVGIMGDEELYLESAGDRAEKEELEVPKPAEAPKNEAPVQNNAVDQATENEAPVQDAAPVQNDAPVSEGAPDNGVQ